MAWFKYVVFAAEWNRLADVLWHAALDVDTGPINVATMVPFELPGA
jgi:hypothetical protein